MASSIIHMAVAKEINDYLNHDYKSILIGSIAPDISKQINQDRNISHFIKYEKDIPELNDFLALYRSNLDDDFVLGYFIHLYTDYLWFKYFLPNFINENESCIYDINTKNKIKVSKDEMLKLIYNDYTNINIDIIDRYNLDLSIFYEPLPNFKNIIKEIPMDRLKVIIDKASIIIENSKKHKSYIFDINEIERFISFSSNTILNDLKLMGIKNSNSLKNI